MTDGSLTHFPHRALLEPYFPWFREASITGQIDLLGRQEIEMNNAPSGDVHFGPEEYKSILYFNWNDT